ncbi:hypothetical protein Tco_1481927 [Tanacetum coccineum]
MRIEQYIQMIDYALLEVIENGNTLPKETVVKGKETVMPITTVEDKAQRRLEVKAISTLIMGIPNEHQLKFNSIKDAKLLMDAIEKRFEKLSQEDVNQKLLRSLLTEWNTYAVVWRNKPNLENMSMDDLYNNLKVYEPEVKGESSSNSSTQNMAFVSSSNNNTDNTNREVNTALGVSPASTQIHPDDLEEIDLRWQMAMLTMWARRFLKRTGRKLNVDGNDTVGFDKSKVECYNFHKKGYFTRECRAPRNQDCKNKEITRKTVLVETTSSTALVSCDGLGGYDWSYEAEEEPNYALMAYSSSSSDSEISNDSTCSKTCLKTVETLKSQNDKLVKYLKKSELMVLGYKTGLQSVEQKLEVYKANESIYKEKIKGLKLEIHIVEPPITGNFMPSSPHLSFIGLDEFTNKPVVENSNAKSSEKEPKIVKKNNDAPTIETLVLEDEEENVSQPKVDKKIVKHSNKNIKFVKSKQLEKYARKTDKHDQHIRQNTHRPRGNQRN